MRIRRHMLSATALAALIGAGAVTLPSARSQSSPNPFASRDYRPNLLGNGGFESWGLGSNGSIPPEAWLVMGDAANTYNGQSYLTIDRMPGEPECSRDVGGGQYACKLTSTQQGNFLSQDLENFSEFRCKTLTLTARFKATNVVTSPTIWIDDGFSASSDTRVLVLGEWRTLSVTHKVSAAATRVQVRIDPGSISLVDDVQLVLGDQPMSLYAPRANPEPGLMQVPLGAVIDWYRFSAEMPVPEGYAIADGSPVEDAASPFFGLPTVDLRQRFVRGAADLGGIGASGGVDAHDLEHDHDIDHYHRTIANPNDFWWIIGETCCFKSPKNTTTFETTGPLGEPHSGNRSGDALGVVDNKPPFVGLLKIMRVR